MSIFKEFLGLNYGLYDPTGDDEGTAGLNFIGYDINGSLKYSDPSATSQNIGRGTSHASSRTMVLLNLHRNGPYGYPTWKQIRTAGNHLTRAQKKNSIFTHLDESDGRNKEIKQFLESAVVDSFHPLSLIGEIKTYNDKLDVFQNRAVEIRTSFANETVFFANRGLDEYYDLVQETDDGYESLTDLYLDGGLDDDGSPLDGFNLLTYRQTIFPKSEYSFLDRTRSRTFYVNTFWRDARQDRTDTGVVGGYGTTVPSQSIWNLDAAEDFLTRLPATNNDGYRGPFQFYIGGNRGYDSQGAEGSLQNSYSQFISKYWNDGLGSLGINNGRPSLLANGLSLVPGNGITHNIGSFLTASAFYSRLHTLKNKWSVINPSGPDIVEIDFDVEDPSSHPNSLHTSSLFQGSAPWTCGDSSGNNPFYDSYSDFAGETRVIGKGFTTIPEFKISSHVAKYLTNGVTSENRSIFELPGALSQLTTTENQQDFYKVLSNSDFLKHFDLVKKDHKDMAREAVITLRCKALKKFLPYQGFYPVDRTNQISKQFYDSYKDNIETSTQGSSLVSITNAEQFAKQAFLTPICAPGILFNTIKSGIAVDYPIITSEDFLRDQTEQILNTRVFTDEDGRMINPTSVNEKSANVMLSNSNRLYGASSFDKLDSIFSKRIPFEALLDPEVYLAGLSMTLQEPHPFGLSDYELTSNWDGKGDQKFKKMISNFLAEVPEFFLKNSSMKVLTSEEEGSPNFGNVVSGSFYAMRVKMVKTLERLNKTSQGYENQRVLPPQDAVSFSDPLETVRENFTMYSRPSAFGPPTYGGGGEGISNGQENRLGSLWGYNFPFTPPYYHGESWCDIIYLADVTGKVSLDTILAQAKEYPYYTRYWTPQIMDAFRDTMGKNTTGKYAEYLNSPWLTLLANSRGSSPASTDVGFQEDWPAADSTGIDTGSTDKNYANKSGYLLYADDQSGGIQSLSPITQVNTPPQSPVAVNLNAMQLDSSVNLFGKGTMRTAASSDPSLAPIEVASSDTIRGKTRWIIQPKFESPMLNFNKHKDLNAIGSLPTFGASQVPRGMWHQHGDIPEDNEGVFLQVTDIPEDWLVGALGIDRNFSREKVKSLADVVGFSKKRQRLGELDEVRQISEAVVAVPFVEKGGTREFFSIARDDIDSCINASKREVSPGTFPAGGPAKTGDTIYNMVKKMQKFVFPPSMDFVKYEEIEPFAMYVFEFKHNLSKQDLSNIWQNTKPEIGSKVEEVESSISHHLLAHELLGQGASIVNGTVDENAKSKGIPSNIQWMVFKVKKRAKTDYFEKIVQKPSEKPSTLSPTGFSSAVTTRDKDISYNWPYDFFSLVELVKIDAEVTFANIGNDDKGQKTIKKIVRKSPLEISKTRTIAKDIDIARGKGKFKK